MSDEPQFAADKSEQSASQLNQQVVGLVRGGVQIRYNTEKVMGGQTFWARVIDPTRVRELSPSDRDALDGGRTMKSAEISEAEFARRYQHSEARRQIEAELQSIWEKQLAMARYTVRRSPSLSRLTEWSDVLPIALRKQVKAMAGDYQPEIQRLHAEGRHRVAAWNAKLAWGTAAWMVCKAPFLAIRDYLLKGFTTK